MAGSGELPTVRGPHGEYQGTLSAELEVRYTEMADGAIPPPMMLRAYGDIDPSYPDRIFTMAEKEQDAQIKVTRLGANAEAFAVIAGAIVTPIVAIGLLVLTLVLFLAGQNAAAIGAMLAGVGVWFGPMAVAAVQSRRKAAAKPAPAKPSAAKAEPKASSTTPPEVTKKDSTEPPPEKG